VARWVTPAGSWVVQVGIPAVAAVRAARGGSRRVAAFAALSMFGTSAIFHSVKHFAGRERPRPDLHLVPTNDSSFPSGHAATSAAAARVLAEGTGLPKLPFAVLAGVVGGTRVYLGVHHPSDVLAGFLIGWGWASVAAKLIPPAGDAEADPEVVGPDLSQGVPSADPAALAHAQASRDGHPCLP